MKDIFPQFSSLIDIDPIIPGLEYVPFSPVSDLIWFLGLGRRSFCCSQLLLRCSPLCKELLPTWWREGHFYPWLMHLPSPWLQNKAFWEKGLCLIFMFHFFTIPKTIWEASKRKGKICIWLLVLKRADGYLSQIEIWTDIYLWSEWALPRGLIWVIGNAISATGARTTVTTTRFEQNLIGLVPIIAQHSW